jgi:hypothetical protein
VALQLPDGTWLSADRFWRFSGNRWTPVVPPGTGRPGLFWFLRSPNWFPAILVAGLIALIPVVGYMNLYGWALATAANLRAGYQIAAPANFDYIGRGARYFAWGCLVGLVNFTIALVAALLAGGSTYAARQDWAWTIAIGAGTGFTVLALLGFVVAPLAVPVLQLIDREGFAAAMSPSRVARTVGQNWDVAWYGALASLAWLLIYWAATSVGSLVPIVGLFAGYLLAIPANGALGLMLAAPLARFGDPPATFNRTHTNLVLAAYVAYSALIALSVWAIGLFAASLISGHPDEVQCVFRSGCSYDYNGERETIADVSSDPNAKLIRARVVFVNHSASSQSIDASDFWLHPEGAKPLEIGPSSQCALPRSGQVPAHSRTTETVCFEVADTSGTFDLHLPWTGLHQEVNIAAG